MKIGIIGSAEVGQALAKGFGSEGHEVVLGTRNPSKKELTDFKTQNPSVRVATFQQAAEHAELIVVATSGSVVEEAIKLAVPTNFNNKVVIDTTNPISPGPPVNGVLKFFTDLDNSLMERIQQLIPDAKLVKAFNSVGNTLMYKPKFSDGPPTMFICGNDDEAKKTVTAILTSFGWETEDMGKAEAARAIEPLCILWCIPGFLRNSWQHAFKLLK
jgi:8-hydroxy-5-deazaflavin:NADPH oxidoreductase